MKSTILTFTFAFASLTSCNKQWTDPSLNATDQNFIVMAASHNLNEIEAGVLAHNKSSDVAVLAFADKMEYEHREAQNELRSLVESNHLNMRYNEKLETMKLQLIQLKGRDFDSSYVHKHLAYQRKILQIFEDEIQNGKDEGLKYYASKYINHLKLNREYAAVLAQNF